MQTGMSVVQDYKDSLKPVSPEITNKRSTPLVAKRPSLPGLTPYRRPFQDRPVESKPTDFLARKTPQK
jgi:hypothetical protein